MEHSNRSFLNSSFQFSEKFLKQIGHLIASRTALDFTTWDKQFGNNIFFLLTVKFVQFQMFDHQCQSLQTNIIGKMPESNLFDKSDNELSFIIENV